MEAVSLTEVLLTVCLVSWMRSVGQARFINTETGRPVRSSFHLKQWSEEKVGLWWRWSLSPEVPLTVCLVSWMVLRADMWKLSLTNLDDQLNSGCAQNVRNASSPHVCLLQLTRFYVRFPAKTCTVDRFQSVHFMLVWSPRVEECCKHRLGHVFP